MPKYGSYVKFAALPGQRDALADLLLQAAASLRMVAGCELYVINTSPAEPEVVWVTEIGESEAASQAALTLESASANIQQVIALLAARPEKITLQPVGGKGLVLA